MDNTETSSMQKRPSSSYRAEETDNERCEVTNNVRSDPDVLLPFCFVKIWPRDARSRNMIKEVVKLFEKMDQRDLQLSEKIREKAFERERAITRVEDLKYMLRKLNLELDKLSNTRKSQAEEVDKHVVLVCDELREMRKEKQRLETKLKDAEEEFEAIIEEIWSQMDHLKDKHHRNEACVCILQQGNGGGRVYWYLLFCDLESIHTGITHMEKSSFAL